MKNPGCTIYSTGCILMLLLLAAVSETSAADLSGTWRGLCRDKVILLTLSQQGAQVTGTIHLDNVSYEVFDGSVDDTTLNLSSRRAKDARGIMPFFCRANFSLTGAGQMTGWIKLRTLLGIRTLFCKLNLQNVDQMADFTLILSHVEKPSNIYLFFTAQDGSGKPLYGLTVDDFELFEDDLPVSQPESTLSILPNPWLYTMSTVLLLDMSSSTLNAATLDPLKASAKEFLSQIAGPDGQEVAIYLFDGSKTISLLKDFTKDIAALQSAIDGITGKDIESTNLNGAVQQGLAVLDGRRKSIPLGALFSGMLVTITDGTDRAHYVTDAAAEASVVSSRHYSFTLGLGQEIDENHLRKLGKSGFAWADNVGAFTDAFAQIGATILSESGKRYILGYCSPSRQGVHKMTLRIKNKPGMLSYAFDAEGFTGDCDAGALPANMETGNGDQCLFNIQPVRRPLLITKKVPITITSDMVTFTENSRVLIDGLDVLATAYRTSGKLIVTALMSPRDSKGPYDVTVITEQEKMTCLGALSFK